MSYGENQEGNQERTVIDMSLLQRTSPESRMGLMTVTPSRLDTSIKQSKSMYKSGIQQDSIMAQACLTTTKDSRLNALHENKLKEMADFLFEE